MCEWEGAEINCKKVGRESGVRDMRECGMYGVGDIVGYKERGERDGGESGVGKWGEMTGAGDLGDE